MHAPVTRPRLLAVDAALMPFGEVGHAMAVVTAKYTRSSFGSGEHTISAYGSLPRDAMLSAALNGAQRVRVIRGGMVCSEPVGGEVLVDTDDVDAIEDLIRALRIVDGAAEQCQVCLGDPVIELCTRDRRRVCLGVQHGTHLRWGEWRDDAELACPAALLAWLEGHGVAYVGRQHAPLADVLESRARQRWLAAAPSSLRRFAERDLRREFATAPSDLLAVLRAELPEPRDQALALFEWLGNGAGTWTVYPAYEQAAERLLLCLPFAALVDALRWPPLSAAQLEGATRFLAGWHFRSERRTDAKRLTRSDTERLLLHALSSGDPEKQRLACDAFS